MDKLKELQTYCNQYNLGLVVSSMPTVNCSYAVDYEILVYENYWDSEQHKYMTLSIDSWEHCAEQMLAKLQK